MTYGAWITPQGEIIEVVDLCQHQSICSYSDARKEGWIATVNPKKPPANLFCVRFNPETVTVAALKSLLKLVKETSEDLIIDSTSLRNIYGLGNPQGSRKNRDIAFIRQLIKERTNLGEL